ncbi:MAG: 3,4-dihydroxy-2-butanone-4-phosphate synthase [Oligoflexales bacterium]|nr:3,4-dihydroxy-2-butanone-4-phosphate synthase [Oligoflexales bacterium]
MYHHDSSDLELRLQRVQQAIDRFAQGEMVILSDDEKRENEGDVIFPAETVSPEKINFMAKEARGLICLALGRRFIERLKLPMMHDHSKGGSPFGTAFTVSIEARTGVTTGISAADRSRTIQVAVADESGPEDLIVPGHIFPLKAKDGGVLERAGQTEGSVDLARLAGRKEAAVICEIMHDDGTMARAQDLVIFSEKHKIPLLAIEDLILYRLLHDKFVFEIKREPHFVTSAGTFLAVWFQSQLDKSVHLALVKGEISSQTCVDVRVHKQDPLADTFFKNSRLSYGLRMLAESRSAVLVCLRNPDPTGLLPFSASDAKPDPRQLGIGAQILRELSVSKMRLHAKSQRSLVGLSGFGLQIEDTVIFDA